MSVRHMLATQAAAHVSAVGGVGTGRLLPTVAAVVGLTGVIIGGLALARSAGRIGSGNGRAGGVLALVMGLVSAVVGGLHTANSAGGLGTGNGLAGAVVALVLGLIGVVIGGLVLVRSRHTGREGYTGADPSRTRYR